MRGRDRAERYGDTRNYSPKVARAGTENSDKLVSESFKINKQ